jgi:hypothetical protein
MYKSDGTRLEYTSVNVSCMYRTVLELQKNAVKWLTHQVRVSRPLSHITCTRSIAATRIKNIFNNTVPIKEVSTQ